MRVAAVGCERAVEAADDFVADAEIHDAEGAVALGSAKRAVELETEVELAADGEAGGLEALEIFEREARADDIGREILIGEAIRSGACDDAGAAGSLLAGSEEAELGVGDAGFLRAGFETAAQAIEGEAVDIGIGE